jgi:HK97 gp10 family phage protein
MARQTFHIEGLQELDEALSELPKAVAKDVLVRVLTEQGAPIKEAGQRLAPRLTGRLADSYTISQKLSRRQKSLNHKESAVEVYIGPGAMAENIQTEFGNAHQAAQPHLRPAFDQNARKVLDGITMSLAAAIEKARYRLAKKGDAIIGRIRRVKPAVEN